MKKVGRMACCDSRMIMMFVECEREGERDEDEGWRCYI